MQVHVAQHDADRTALGGSLLVRIDLAVFQDACLQPAPDKADQARIRCTSAAQRTALITLGNSTSIPSPVFFTIRPWCSLIFGSTNSRRCAVRRSCVPPSSTPISRE